MATTTPIQDWARIDLALQNLDALRISWHAENEVAFQSAFGDLLDEDGDLFAFVPYTRQGIHYMRAQVASRETDLGANRISVNYSFRSEWPDSPVPASLRKEKEFAESVARIQEWGPAICNATFAFGPSQAMDTVLSLPLDLAIGGESELPIDAITGFKGRKSAQEEERLPGYRFILDRLSDDSLWLSLSFDLPISPGPRSPQEALKVAAKFRDDLVFKRSNS